MSLLRSVCVVHVATCVAWQLRRRLRPLFAIDTLDVHFIDQKRINIADIVQLLRQASVPASSAPSSLMNGPQAPACREIVS